MQAVDTLELSLFSLALLAAAAVLIRQLPSKWGWRSALLLFAAVATAGTLWARHTSQHLSARAHIQAQVPRIGRPGGYTSSDACRSCHPSQYQSWHDSYHRTMTQYVGPDTVQADFNDVRLKLGADELRVWKEGSAFWAELPDPEYKDMVRNRPTPGPIPMVRKQLGMLTGSHHMQIFWVPSKSGNQQLVFPFAWLIAERRWVPVHTTFLRDPKLPEALHIWNLNCIKCHSTAGQPRPDPAIGGLDSRMGDIGISCEACHGPGEEHVKWHQNPVHRLQSRGSTHAAARLVNPAKLPKEQSAQVCGQCHGIKWIPASENFSQEGFSFRPGQNLNASTPIVRPTHWREQPFLQAGLKQNPRFIDEHYWPDGMVRVSGRDFSGTVEAPCFQKGEMSCVSCHSMHTPASKVSQMSPGKETNEGCLQCHSAMRGKEETHSHHKNGSSGGLCYNCHMPHTTYGLLKAIRSHQITSPTVNSTLRTGRPNACNLCHLDQSLEWTADHLETWFHQPKPTLSQEHKDTSSTVIMAMQGDAGLRALMAWHMGWQPAQAASGTGWMPPYLGVLMADPYSAVRFIAGRSLKSLPSYADLAYDYLAPEGEWERVRSEVLRKWMHSPEKPASNTRLLVAEGPSLDQSRFDSLLSRRNHRSMDLQE